MFRMFKFAAICLLIPSLVWAKAAAEPFAEGHQYKVLDAQITQLPVVLELKQRDPKDKVQVLEFFSYGCHWCNSLEPKVQAWQADLKDYVSFHRLPVVFHPRWRLYGKAYYAAENLKVLDRIHSNMFHAIHDQNNTLDTQEKIQALFSEEGVNPDQFNESFGSFQTARQLKWAQLVTKAYHIRSVPTFIINGPKKSYMTSASLAGGEDTVFEVVDFLVEKLHKQQVE